MILFIIALIITVFGAGIALRSLDISAYNINKYLHPEHFKNSFINKKSMRVLLKNEWIG